MRMHTSPSSDELLLASMETRLDSHFGGLLVSFLATREKLAELSRIDWSEEFSSRFQNKMNMKDLGGAIIGYSDFLTESTIYSLSTIIEDTWIQLRKDKGVKYDLWDPTVSVEFQHEARMVRCMANVLKHSQGMVVRQTSKHAKFLVDECGLTEGYELVLFARVNPPRIDLPELIYRTYIYCWGLVKAIFGNEDGVLALPDEERKPIILEILVPKITGLRI